MQKRVSIFTLGCRVNHYESEAIADSASLAGYQRAKWGEKADIAIINSCSLTTTAVVKTRRAIAFFKKQNPQSAICVTGCAAQINFAELAKIQNVKWIIGNAHKSRCVEIIEKNPAKDGAQIFVEKISKTFPDSAKICRDCAPIPDRMNLKIQDGCDNFCSYCIIPFARGLPRSRNFFTIISDAQNMVERGVREIVLTGINISKFSTQDGALIELIDELNKIDGLLRLRIGSIEPPRFPLEELLARAADTSHKLMPHLHISAQSLNNKVLSAMRRKYEAEEFLETISTARAKVPDIFLGCDIICGHPEEGEAEYAQTRERALASGLSDIHVFTFSPRVGTLAEKMSNTPDIAIRKARADDLREVTKQINKTFLKSQTGKIRPVLLENRLSNGAYMAYTDNYIQLQVHGLPEGMRNQIVNVKLEASQTSSQLEARVIS